MSSVIEIKIPDIGDFADVEVIELLVAPGDRITAEDPLLTLESDKATMEVPSPASGTVREMTVAVGDRVSEGSSVAMLDTGDGEPAAPGEQPPTAESATGGEAGGQTEDSS
ncbi:MAG: branched-chain alpha-keto acid dehydrogenase subunit E2, partial [Gammaproteobacteria bacterium]|nr:branched-chain alpha-keto acid dehydrogenase subunit E2 [Gammaproteobacteria bacterium]